MVSSFIVKYLFWNSVILYYRLVQNLALGNIYIQKYRYVLIIIYQSFHMSNSYLVLPNFASSFVCVYPNIVFAFYVLCFVSFFFLMFQTDWRHILCILFYPFFVITCTVSFKSREGSSRLCPPSLFLQWRGRGALWFLRTLWFPFTGLQPLVDYNIKTSIKVLCSWILGLSLHKIISYWIYLMK